MVHHARRRLSPVNGRLQGCHRQPRVDRPTDGVTDDQPRPGIEDDGDSNRGFAEWGDVFGDPVVATALLDRLLHHAVVVQIDKLSTASACRAHAEHVRSKALITSLHPSAETEGTAAEKWPSLRDDPVGIIGEFYFGTLGNFTAALTN